MNILITGVAGFIGYHVAKKILKNNNKVIGIDNINNYYDVNLKKNRIKELKKNKKFFFYKVDIIQYKKLNSIIKNNQIKIIIHLAAQAGVRYSIKNPQTYFKSNLEGFFNILETSRYNKIKHLIYASTSSVYGDTKKFPLSETESTDRPLSFYAATKKSNEIMAHSYSYIYKLPSTGVRFFTVYGPFGRPDMALFKFTKNIIKNNPIELYNKGNHLRDFTYIDDIVDGIYSLINKQSQKTTPYEIFNIGNGTPKKLLDYLKYIEKNLNKKSKIKRLPLQVGDILKTHSNINKLKKYTGYNPKTNIDNGIKKFIEWFKDYYKVN
ncbi:NAD-dependent epimerase/dehydratase family protein [Pelagibacteraceae bacterium]|nr:NAD-dependent epimerase/dehydratase family protein [Pelagibacteraceae bacterium]